MLKQHYVIFVSPGTMFSEEVRKEIDSWDVEKAKEMAREIRVRHGATPYGFQFITRGRTDDELDAKQIDKSGFYFLGGRVMTLDEVQAEMPDQTTLISNMKNNGYDRIIVNDNSYRVHLPFDDTCTLLDWDQNPVEEPTETVA